jgi:hypothetical protein
MLATSQKSGKMREKVSTSDTTDHINALRRILTTQSRREVGYDEAKEVSASLIEFYEILATEVCDETE